jgi:hypothetical protein
METMSEVWKRHDLELDRAIEILELDIYEAHMLRLMQVRHQREQLRAFYKDFKN